MGANVVFETLDEGIHWKVISPDLTRDDKTKQQRPGGPISADVTGEEMFGTISSIAFSPLTDNVIWTGSDDGLVHVTTDGGAHWTQVRPPALPDWSTITCIEPSHTDAGTAYLSASRFDWDDFHPYVYKTTDYGKHWTAITAGLPQRPVRRERAPGSERAPTCCSPARARRRTSASTAARSGSR